MIEAAREILEMVKHMPQYTLWVLAGILFYKVFIVGSWIAIARLLIVKAHDLLSKPKVIELKHKDYRITDSAEERLSTLFYEMTKERAGSGYVHGSDIEYAISAIRQKRELEKKN